jgi:hypothetical protein
VRTPAICHFVGDFQFSPGGDGTVDAGLGKKSVLVAADDILLDGWGLPFQTDTEGAGIMAGNAYYNLSDEPEAIRRCIEAKTDLPVSDGAKAELRG